MEQIRGLLQDYIASPGAPPKPAEAVHQDYQNVAQTAPKDVVAQGIASAFRSNQTPPFAQMVSSLFDQSGGPQRANLLNQLLGAAGPGLASDVLSRLGLSDLAGSLAGSQGNVTPDQASRVPAPAVKEMASQAESQDPSIVDTLSRFYADHPEEVKKLGHEALSIAMSAMGNRSVA
ncbi:MAG TPA: hypothetical protein VFJ58_23485 [Armatimonadota bacterium]|nr:hypothetical protein [Armatimonadota bacterium]